MTAPPRRIQLFGVNGRTGRYALPVLSSVDLEVAARLALAQPELVADARRSMADRQVAGFQEVMGPGLESSRRGGPKHSPGFDLPEWEIAQRGWGVVFPADDRQVPAIREALAPLFAWRRQQVGAVSDRHFREMEYRPGELLFDFRRRYRVTPGIPDPKKIPGYLLLVGGPQAIPFDFQTELAAQEYAVGRIDFDSIEGYASYAESVVQAERADAPAGSNPRRIAFFAPEHPDDPLSKESSGWLAAPLADACALPGDGWTVERILGVKATKHRFAELLGRAVPPSILFTAGHGAIFESGDERQAADQGALVCADWQGPEAAVISESDYFSAGDLAAETRLGGMIAFHFACCSLGVPAQNELHLAGLPIPEWLAPEDLVARLPQRMLAQGALAAIGHLDLVFAYSFREGGSDGPVRPEPPLLYDRCLKDLLRGRPVGEAMGPFRSCYQARLVEHAELSQRAHEKREVAAETLWEVEAACHDARYYAVLGDPAVRLPAPTETES